MVDKLGDRIKSNYEDRTRYSLPRRTYTIIRLDGKAFHTYTSNLKKPFDMDLIEDMQKATKYLCEHIQGCVMGYVQSDEISLLLTDFATPTTDAWYDGNIQKIASVSASMVTAIFNQLRAEREFRALAFFDSRTFTIADRVEVMNYFIWRQKDATRNSVSMAAHHICGHKATMGKSNSDKQEMLFQKGVNWNDYPVSAKNGSIVLRETVEFESEANGKYVRNIWQASGAPNFRTFLPTFLPTPELEVETME